MSKLRNFFYLVLCLFPIGLQAQEVFPDNDSKEKLVNWESQNWLKLARFQESAGYGDYDLYFQRMNWEVDPNVRFIEGAVTSYFKPKVEGFQEIGFDLQDDMTVDSVLYHDEKIDFEHASNRVTVSFTSEIPIDQKDSLTIWYHGTPLEGNDESFSLMTLEGGAKALWTLSEPYGAMLWWPCKQSLVDKIDSMEVLVTCPDGNKVASNGKLISESSSNGKTTVHWKHRYPIATYLVAIAVAPYQEYTDWLELEDGSQIEILNYMYPEYFETAQGSSQWVLDIMSLYNELIGEYPFADEKYGHAQFGWGGGMEHQTMSFMVNMNFGLVAHEMAHQWFGDCLTLNSWQDIWLNEGFATYFTGISYERLLDGEYWEPWKTNRVDQITSLPSGSVFVTDTTSFASIFSSRLSYSKGAYLLHMLRWELGDDAFFNALKSYFNDPALRYGFATNEALISHLEEAGDTTLTEFFNDWYYGEGYPIYHLTHYQDASDGTYKLKISQEQSDPSVDFFEMHVPVRVWKDGVSTDLRLYNTENNQEFVLDEVPDQIEFDPDLWLISKNSTITTAVISLEEAGIQVFPNPVSNQLHILSDRPNQIKSVAIYDIRGRNVLQIENFSSSKVDVSQLKQGNYFLKLQTENGSFSHQFIKN